MTKNITGESLKTFTTCYLNTSRYETAKQLGNRYGLDEDQLFNFYKRAGRMSYDPKTASFAIRDDLFTPTTGVQFGPVVRANGTLYFYSNYWDKVLTDVKHAVVLREIRKANVTVQETLEKCLKIETPKKSSKSEKPHWKSDFIQTNFRVSGDGKLLVEVSGEWVPVDNKTGKVQFNHKKYLIESLIVSLNRGEDYRNREGEYQAKDLIPVKKVTDNSSLNVPVSNYKSYALVAHTKDGRKIVKTKFETAEDRNALIGLLLSI